eukprot:765928-Hanusia_phi.AAC.1
MPGCRGVCQAAVSSGGSLGSGDIHDEPLGGEKWQKVPSATLKENRHVKSQSKLADVVAGYGRKVLLQDATINVMLIRIRPIYSR